MPNRKPSTIKSKSKGVVGNNAKLITSSDHKNKKFIYILSLSLILISLVLFLNSAYKRIYIAKVNGRPISRLEYIKELEKNDKGMVLDNMITKAIIFQEADKNGIKISDSDIQTELGNIRLSVESQGTTLEEILLYQGITYEQLLENIEIQKILEIILKDNIVVTDEEVEEMYEENKDIYGNDKSYEELKESIRYQLMQSKITDSYKSWLDGKKSSSIIQKYL